MPSAHLELPGTPLQGPLGQALSSLLDPRAPSPTSYPPVEPVFVHLTNLLPKHRRGWYQVSGLVQPACKSLREVIDPMAADWEVGNVSEEPSGEGEGCSEDP